MKDQNPATQIVTKYLLMLTFYSSAKVGEVILFASYTFQILTKYKKISRYFMEWNFIKGLIL